MSANENNRNGNGSMNTPVAESSEPVVSQGSIHAPESTNGTDKAEPGQGNWQDRTEWHNLVRVLAHMS